MTLHKPHALITGATSGIGRSTAYLLAENGYNLTITGRRNDRLMEIKSQLEIQFQVTVDVLNFDIRQRSQVQQALDSYPIVPDILINNAGLASGLSSLSEGNVDDWEKMIDTNIKGLLYVSRVLIPKMQQRGSGHIVNIGSIAGKEVYDKGNVYCGTKHMVDALTKAMRLENAGFGLKVTAIHPGAVKTEFSLVRFHGDEERAEKVYEGFDYLTPEDIAQAILYCIQLPHRVNINEMVIMPQAQPMASQIIRKMNQ